MDVRKKLHSTEGSLLLFYHNFYRALRFNSIEKIMFRVKWLTCQSLSKSAKIKSPLARILLVDIFGPQYKSKNSV